MADEIGISQTSVPEMPEWGQASGKRKGRKREASKLDDKNLGLKALNSGQSVAMAKRNYATSKMSRSVSACAK